MLSDASCYRKSNHGFQFNSTQTGHRVEEEQTRGRTLQRAQIGVDPGHATDTGERVVALGDDFAVPFLGHQIHHDPGLLGANGQIHGATDGWYRAWFAGAPVRQISCGGHLKCSQNTNIQVAATHHGKAVGLMEERAAWLEGDGLLACIDEVVVLMTSWWRWAHTKDAILAVQNDFAIWRNVVGDERGLPDTEIHVGAVVDVLGHAAGQFILGSSLVVGHAGSFT